MKNILITTTLCVASCFTLSATAYDSEYSIGTAYTEFSDTGWKDKIDAIYVSGTWYTAPVNTKKGPLAEAAFLSKSTSISLAYLSGDDDYTETNNPSANTSLDLTGWIAGWHWVTSENDVILDLQYEYSELEAGSNSADSETLSLGVGTYLNPTNSILFSYSQYQVEGTDFADSIGIEYHGLFGASNNMSLQAAILKTTLDDNFGGNDGTGATVAFTYYINNQLGIGFGYALDVASTNGEVSGSYSVDDIDSDLFSLKVDWFAKENLRFAFEYVDGEIDTVDVEGVSAEMSFRF